MDETSYTTPLFNKDKKYTECENCDKTGKIYQYDECGELEREDCPDCSGTGQIEIEN